MKNMAGFSLIEFLIAMLISTFLLTGVMTLYLSQRKTYVMAQALERMQENGRLATQQMTKAIHRAGYIGCGRINEVVLHNPFSWLHFDLATALFGFHDGHTTSNYHGKSLEFVLKKAKPHTDILIVQAANSTACLAKAHNANITIDGQCNFKQKNVLVIADCQQANIFQVAATQKNVVIPTLKLDQEYFGNSQIGRFSLLVYYIADTGRKNSAGDKIYALFCRDLFEANTLPNELIEGVEDLQIQYGVTTETKALHYYLADQVPDWQQVRLISVSMLLTSVQPVFSEHQSYYFHDKKNLAKDRQLHREWHFIAALKER